MDYRFLSAAVAVAALAAAAPAVSAELLVNGSFEDTGGATREGWGGFTFGAGFSPTLPGWTVNSGSVDITDNTTSWKPADTGNNSLDMNGWEPGSISQTFNTVAGQLYTVSYAFSRNLAGAPDPATATMTVDGVNELVSAANSPVFGTPGAMQWLHDSFTFTATGSSATLTLAATSGGNGGVFFDSMSVSGPVPEPATWALMILGFGGAGAMLRRRQQMQVA